MGGRAVALIFHVWVDAICSPSGRVIMIRWFVFLLFITGIPGNKKYDVVPGLPTPYFIDIFMLFFSFDVSVGGLFPTLVGLHHSSSLEKY